jgi:hypothetical protein
LTLLTLYQVQFVPNASVMSTACVLVHSCVPITEGAHFRMKSIK